MFGSIHVRCNVNPKRLLFSTVNFLYHSNFGADYFFIKVYSTFNKFCFTIFRFYFKSVWMSFLFNWFRLKYILLLLFSSFLLWNELKLILSNKKYDFVRKIELYCKYCELSGLDPVKKNIFTSERLKSEKIPWFEVKNWGRIIF